MAARYAHPPSFETCDSESRETRGRSRARSNRGRPNNGQALVWKPRWSWDNVGPLAKSSCAPPGPSGESSGRPTSQPTSIEPKAAVAWKLRCMPLSLARSQQLQQRCSRDFEQQPFGQSWDHRPRRARTTAGVDAPRGAPDRLCESPSVGRRRPVTALGTGRRASSTQAAAERSGTNSASSPPVERRFDSAEFSRQAELWAQAALEARSPQSGSSDDEAGPPSPRSSASPVPRARAPRPGDSQQGSFAAWMAPMRASEPEGSSGAAFESELPRRTDAARGALEEERFASSRHCYSTAAQLEQQVDRNRRLEERVRDLESLLVDNEQKLKASQVWQSLSKAKQERDHLRARVRMLQTKQRALGAEEALREGAATLCRQADQLQAAQRAEEALREEAATLRRQVSHLQSALDEATSESLCVICMAEPATFVALPCGHLAYCGQCRLDTCAVCRKRATKWVRVFRT